MVGTEVSTSDDLPCFPRRESWDWGQISEIMGEIFQSKMRLGYERLVITIREAANRAARRAAKASPVLGSQGGEISITVWIIRPPEFQQTAAWAESSLTADQNWFWRHLEEGAAISQTEGWDLDFHAWRCSSEIFLTDLSKEIATGRESSGWALFQENQTKSQVTVAKIWKRWCSAKGMTSSLLGFRIIMNQSIMEEMPRAWELRGKKDSRQTTRAKMQLKKRWTIE